MAEGFIAALVLAKGYGWIARGGGERDLFVHASDCDSSIVFAELRGERVTFDEVADPRSGRPKAVNVKLATD
jgi:cold shock CspA family protein